MTDEQVERALNLFERLVIALEVLIKPRAVCGNANPYQPVDPAICEREGGHEGPHRNNQTVPPLSW